MGYVYLLSTVTPDGLNEQYKIGVTKNNILKRIKILQTGNSEIINLINYYETENYFKVEKSMHRLYASQKSLSNNEWFTLENEHVLSFLSECKKIDEMISFMLENNHFYK
jgi:hypothetical protein